MLGFFRRVINSRAGLIVTFLVIGVIAIAFAAGDVTGLRGGGAGVGGGAVAKVGGQSVGEAEFAGRVQREMEGFRQQQPTLDMATFVNQGGFDGTLQRITTGLALEEFGRDAGMVVSKRAVDGQIASIPGLQGPSGQFDEQIYRRLLADRKLTDAQVRADITRETLATQLTAPALAARQVAQQIALPYAALLLERRAGEVAVIPLSAVPQGATPTDAELQTFYRRNAARYSVPERRTARYAIVTPDMVRAAATPTDAEIAAAYQADRQKYAATEKRDITQVVVADQAGANAIATRVRGGASLAEAARAAGLEASEQKGAEKAGYATLTSPQVADQLFAAAQGALVGPVRSPLGFVVARVDRIEQVAARPLAAVRGEIAAALGKQKLADALSQLHDKIDDALADNATFDEVVGDNKLAARTTPALTAAGTDPTDPASKPDPQLAQVVTAAYQSSEGDAPQLVSLGQDGSFALVALGRVVPAAPRPLAEVRERVAQDFVADRRRQQARRIAAQVVASVNLGTSLAQALSAAGVSVPAPKPIAATRAELPRAPENARVPLTLLFGLQPNRAQLAPASDGSAFAIVRLGQVQRADPSRNPEAVRGTVASFAQLVGREYAEQFVRAVRDTVGVRTDPAAIARVRAGLLGQGGGQ